MEESVADVEGSGSKLGVGFRFDGGGGVGLAEGGALGVWGGCAGR